MTDPIYKKIELTASSTAGMQEAIGKAAATTGNMRWFEVIEARQPHRKRQNRALAGYR